MPEPCPPCDPAPCQSTEVPDERPKVTRFVSAPGKPASSGAVAEFAARVRADTQTMAEIGKHYGVGERTVHRWAREFGVAPVRRNSSALRGPIKANARSITAATLQAISAVGQGSVSPDGQFDPKSDPEVARVLALIQETTADVRSTPDLARLQRLILKLLVLILAKAPHTLTSMFGSAMELYKLTVFTRKVEAELPVTFDPITIRQDATRQLLQELGAVLTKEEQETVNGLLREAARRVKLRAASPDATANPIALQL